jgi:Tfp pilus assembly protein PilW
MISSIHPTRPSQGFTLVETLVGLGISGFLLAGVLSAFLMFTRSGVAVTGYSRMEASARRGVSAFARDVRMASDEMWNSATSITLTLPGDYVSMVNRVTPSQMGVGIVTYFYDPQARALKRKPGNNTSAGSATSLCNDVDDLQFQRYSRNNAPATGNADTKRIQLKMRLRTKAVTVVDQTSLVVSASYVMRNKPSN